MAERFASAADIDVDTEQRARKALRGLRGELDDQLADRVLVFPTAASPAPPLTSTSLS